jgi:hypothetical protein
MRIRRSVGWIGIATLAGLLGPYAVGSARAEHDHSAMMMEHGDDDASEVSASVSLEAANYDNGDFVGSYQGVMPQLGWTHGRFGANAMIGLYHVEENGLAVNGVGDAMFSGHVTAWRSDSVQTGVSMHVMVPTGSEMQGLGMGHVMFMPSTWGNWHQDNLTVSASAGYSRAATSLGGGHQHGGPLVDPMSLQELTWSAGGDLAVGAGVHVGARMLGGMAIGAGRDRVIGGSRVGWGTDRVSTGVELQLGLVGDPFSVRGVVDTALRF